MWVPGTHVVRRYTSGQNIHITNKWNQIKRFHRNRTNSKIQKSGSASQQDIHLLSAYSLLFPLYFSPCLSPFLSLLILLPTSFLLYVVYWGKSWLEYPFQHSVVEKQWIHIMNIAMLTSSWHIGNSYSRYTSGLACFCLSRCSWFLLYMDFW